VFSAISFALSNTPFLAFIPVIAPEVARELLIALLLDLILSCNPSSIQLPLFNT
jgi:hypothetical protein